MAERISTGAATPKQLILRREQDQAAHKKEGSITYWGYLTCMYVEAFPHQRR